MIDQIRLIIHTDSRKKPDVNTFAAAKTLVSDYRQNYSKQGDTIKMVFVKTGRDIVNEINQIGVGKLISLDIVSHGNQGGIHISRNLLKSIPSGIIQKKAPCPHEETFSSSSIQNRCRIHRRIYAWFVFRLFF